MFGTSSPSGHRQDTSMKSRHSPVFQRQKWGWRLLRTHRWAAGFEHTMPAPLCRTASVRYRTSPGSHRPNCPPFIPRDGCYTYVILLGSLVQPSEILPRQHTTPDTPRKPQPQCTTPSPILATPHHAHWLMTEQGRGTVQVGDEHTWAPHL